MWVLSRLNNPFWQSLRLPLSSVEVASTKILNFNLKLLLKPNYYSAQARDRGAEPFPRIHFALWKDGNVTAIEKLSFVSVHSFISPFTFTEHRRYVEVYGSDDQKNSYNVNVSFTIHPCFPRRKSSTAPTHNERNAPLTMPEQQQTF